MRQTFEEQLLDLKKRVATMGDSAQMAIKTAMSSLKERDLDLAETIIEGDKGINAQGQEIEEFCTRLIATQQPFAGDLRKIVAGYKIVSSIERIGDLAADLAKTSKRIGSVPLIKPLVDLPQMARYVEEMIIQGIEAYIRENPDAAREMAQLDHKVDYLYRKLFIDLTILMTENPKAIEQGTYLLFAGRYLERSGDYCTNIAEEILFMVSGVREDLNRD